MTLARQAMLNVCQRALNKHGREIARIQATLTRYRKGRYGTITEALLQESAWHKQRIAGIEKYVEAITP